MRARRYRALLVSAFGILGCSDATTRPNVATDTLTLSFCDSPWWAGIQNEGGQWQTISGSKVTVEATNRIVIAQYNGSGSRQIRFHYLTRQQARETFQCRPGSKQLTGRVDPTGDWSAQIGMGMRSAFISPGTSAFTITQVPEGPLDLVASNGTRAIIRRDQNIASGTMIPTLDFSSNESFALTTDSIKHNLQDLNALHWRSEIATNGGTRLTVASSPIGGGAPCCPPWRLFTIPTSHLQPGDLNHVTVIASVNFSDFRVVENFTTNRADVVAFGPAASQSTVTRPSGEDGLWRVDVAVQPEYAGQILISGSGGFTPENMTYITIQASKEYIGGATTWSLTIPNLSKVTGFVGGQVDIPAHLWIWPKQGRWLYEESARDGDVYLSAESEYP